jgi:hypothetical protein
VLPASAQPITVHTPAQRAGKETRKPRVATRVSSEGSQQLFLDGYDVVAYVTHRRSTNGTLTTRETSSTRLSSRVDPLDHQHRQFRKPRPATTAHQKDDEDNVDTDGYFETYGLVQHDVLAPHRRLGGAPATGGRRAQLDGKPGTTTTTTAPASASLLDSGDGRRGATDRRTTAQLRRVSQWLQTVAREQLKDDDDGDPCGVSPPVGSAGSQDLKNVWVEGDHSTSSLRRQPLDCVQSTTVKASHSAPSRRRRSTLSSIVGAVHAVAISSNTKRSIRLLHKLAESGNARAMMTLGALYSQVPSRARRAPAVAPMTRRCSVAEQWRRARPCQSV